MDPRQREPLDRPPTWPPARCPAWCARPHSPQDHPEDRIHRSEAVLVPAVVTQSFLPVHAYAAEVQLFVSQPDSVGDAWVSLLLDQEPLVQLNVTVESAARLHSALQTALALDRGS